MRYPKDSIVQDKSGYLRVKIDTKNKWMRRSRFVMSEVEGRDLLPNEKVFHRDCSQRTNDDEDNLVIIKINTTKYKPLDASRPIFVPGKLDNLWLFKPDAAKRRAKSVTA